MSREHADPGRLLVQTFALIRGNMPLAGAALVIMAAIDVGADYAGTNASTVNLLTFPVSLAFQYEITLAALAYVGLAQRRGRRRLWALFGVNLLSGIAILIGMILLVLPGLYLYVRWSLAVPILIAQEAGPTEALSRSSEEIRGQFWALAGLFLLVYLPLLAAMIVGVIAVKQASFVSSLVTNIAINLSLVAGWFAAVAAYADGKSGERLEEVFA